MLNKSTQKCKCAWDAYSTRLKHKTLPQFSPFTYRNCIFIYSKKLHSNFSPGKTARVCVYSSVCLSVCLSIYLPTYLPTYVLFGGLTIRIKMPVCLSEMKQSVNILKWYLKNQNLRVWEIGAFPCHIEKNLKSWHFTYRFPHPQKKLQFFHKQLPYFLRQGLSSLSWFLNCSRQHLFFWRLFPSRKKK